MSKTSDDQPYVSLASAVACLGEDGERKLVNAHVEDRLTLIGRRRDLSGLAAEEGPIPPYALARWNPDGNGAVRLNLQANSIEANAGAAFASFEQHAHHAYEDVQVAAHEVSALAEFLRTVESVDLGRNSDTTTPAALRRKGRPQGSGGFKHADELLFPEVDKRRQADPDKSLSKIADELLPKLKGNSDESKKKRFAKRYREWVSNKADFR